MVQAKARVHNAANLVRGFIVSIIALAGRKGANMVLMNSGLEPHRDYKELKLKLTGYTGPGHELHRNILLDTLYASLPRDPQVKVQIYNAEIAPLGYTQLALPQRSDILHGAGRYLRSPF
jgi:hypothetical protein